MSWTATDINSSNFGAAIQAINTVAAKPTTETAQVDHIRITVYYTLPTMTVSTTGTQTATMNIPSTDNYVGGAFTFITDINTATTTQIVITDAGTVNANLNLSNLKIRYETAETCTYDGNETYFNETGVSFNSSEKATATGTMSVGTSQVCVYVILDVGSGASNNETLEIEITNPSTDVTVSAGTVSPSSVVAITETTTLQTAPTVSCSVSTSTTSFGTLTVSAVSTSTPDIVVTMSCNHAGGGTLKVHDSGDGSNPGLYSSTATYLVTSTTATLEAGTAGYGIQGTVNTGSGTGGTLTINPIYDKTGNDVGGLTIADTDISSSSEPIANRATTIKHKAAISGLTKAASDYSDTITYSCTGN